MILNSIDKVKDYVGVNTNYRIDIFESHIEHAENKFIKPILGTTLYNAIESYVNTSDSTTEAKYDRLINYIERASAFFTYMIGIPFFDVIHTRNGFGVVEQQGIAPASRDRVANLKKAVTDGAYDAIENLLKILEDHITDYPEWQSSDAYSFQYDYLVPNAMTLSKSTPVYEDRQLFLTLRPYIKDAERIDIIPSLGIEYISVLKERIKDRELTDGDKAIIDDLQNACGNYALARATPSLYSKLSAKGITTVSNFGDLKSATESSVERLVREFENKADTYLNLVMKYMYENIESFPVFMESSAYVDRTDGFENEEGNPIFVAGPKG